MITNIRSNKLISMLIMTELSTFINFAFADNTTHIGSSYFQQNPKPKDSSNITTATPTNTPQTNSNNTKTNTTEPANATIHDLHRIGSSYFKKPSEDTHPSIKQIGISYEQRAGGNGASWVYPFFDYLSTNNIYFEIRTYFVYNYISQAPAVPNVLISSENNVIGGGVRGFLGYLIPITRRFSIQPAMSLWYMNNGFYTYSDNLGNSISSNSYAATLGAKLELELNEILALYFSYTVGYEYTTLSGSGIYANANNPNVNAVFSGIEIGLPYNINNSWSIVPYTQLNTASSQPNATASQPIWNINQLTASNITYAIRGTYTW